MSWKVGARSFEKAKNCDMLPAILAFIPAILEASAPGKMPF